MNESKFEELEKGNYSFFKVNNEFYLKTVSNGDSKLYYKLYKSNMYKLNERDSRRIEKAIPNKSDELDDLVKTLLYL